MKWAAIAKEVGYQATQWDVEGLLQIKVAYRPKKINRSHLTQIRVVETDHKVYVGRPPYRLVSLNQTRRHRSLKTLV